MKTKKYILALCLALLSMGFTACSDNDDATSSSMIINKVYLEDVKSTVPDREVNFARLGQMIRVEGSGFTGLQKVYINGYDTYFNNALLTDNNVWVTLNQKTPIYDAASDVRNTIILEKGDGNRCSFTFEVRSSSPSISEVSCTLPQPGELITVKGANLQEITEVILPGDVKVTEGITSDKDGEFFTFKMPEGVTEAGELQAIGANGIAVSAPYFNDNRCYIINFDGKGVQGAWSATLQPEDLVDDPLGTGRGKVAELIPASVLAESDVIKAGVSSVKGYYTAGNDDPDDDWSRMFSIIPSATPVDSVAIQFDIYCPDPWDATGQLEITLQNNLSNYGWQSACTRYSEEYTNQATAWVPWMDEETGLSAGPFQTTGWQTITIPLSKFGNYTNKDIKWTFGDVVKDKNSGSYRNFGFFFCNSDVDFDGDSSTENDIFPSQPFFSHIYLDNFRVVRVGGRTISDYPE